MRNSITSRKVRIAIFWKKSWQLTSNHFIKSFSFGSLNSEAASFEPSSHLHVRRQSSSASFQYRQPPPSPTRQGLSASIHAPLPQRKGLNTSIHAPSEEDLCDSIYTPGSPPWQDLSASIHAPCTPPNRNLNTSIHAPSQQEVMESTPIPVIKLSPDYRLPRVIDPLRDRDLIVLVGRGSIFSVSPWMFLDSILVSNDVVHFRHVWICTGSVMGVIWKGMGASRCWRVLTMLPISFFSGEVHLWRWSSSHCGIVGMVERWRASRSFCNTQCSVCGWNSVSFTNYLNLQSLKYIKVGSQILQF